MIYCGICGKELIKTDKKYNGFTYIHTIKGLDIFCHRIYVKRMNKKGIFLLREKKCKK